MYETINQIGGRMTYLIGSTNGMMRKENEKILKISEKNRNFSNGLSKIFWPSNILNEILKLFNPIFIKWNDCKYIFF